MDLSHWFSDFFGEFPHADTEFSGGFKVFDHLLLHKAFW